MSRARALWVGLAALAVASCGGGPSSPSLPVSPTPLPDTAQQLEGGGVTVRYQPADAAWAPTLHADGVAGREDAARFFGAEVMGSVRVEVLPDRTALTAHWRRIWSSPGLQTECWMIAAGDAGGISILSPGAWARDACGHDATNAIHRSRVMSHEVVHVHHARNNPSWVSTSQGMAWFIEGLAVLASGQLDDERRAFVREQTAAGQGPTRLSDVLPRGYDFAGSLVASIDRRYGRAALGALLGETRQDLLLQRLAVSEAELIAEWRAQVLDGR
jgi:hypothetical protein